MSNQQLLRVKTISEYHRLKGLPKPEHPLISLIDYSAIKHLPEYNGVNWVYDFYCIALKRGFDATIRYGQQEYDFDEGTMFFIAPGQVFGIQANSDAPGKSGWIMLLHPDFLWNSPLGKSIRQYEYFGYAVHEALFLSDKEERVIEGVIDNIRQEYHSNIDKFSQQIIVSHLEVLFNYADRFYHRQFITRSMGNHQVLARLEEVLDNYFKDNQAINGLPTVQYIAEQLNLSADYLSTLLKVATGLNTQQHIHEKLIAVAKEQLSATQLSVCEIAYALGFEHSQLFSKLFKTKTSLSPLEFRQTFN